MQQNTILPAQQDDTMLIASLRERDSVALATVYEKYSPAIYGFILKKSDQSKAINLLQEVFIVFYRSCCNKAWTPVNGSLLLALIRIATQCCQESNSTGKNSIDEATYRKINFAKSVLSRSA